MTSEHSVSKKEPLVHISKRDRISFGKAWGIRIIAVLISLVVCALVIKVKSIRSISFDRGWSSRNGKTFVGDDP